MSNWLCVHLRQFHDTTGNRSAVHYSRQNLLKESASSVYSWHMNPDAKKKLTPHWQPMEVVEYQSVAENSRAIFRTRIFGMPFRWGAEHFDIQTNKQFCDRQLKGPFKQWVHRHLFIPESEGVCLMRDEVDFCLRGGWLVNYLLKPLVLIQVRRLFDYRHAKLSETFGLAKADLSA